MAEYLYIIFTELSNLIKITQYTTHIRGAQPPTQIDMELKQGGLSPHPSTTHLVNPQLHDFE